MTVIDSVASQNLDQLISRILEESENGKVKMSRLCAETGLEESLFDHLRSMRSRGLVSFSGLGDLVESTIVTLAHG